MKSPRVTKAHLSIKRGDLVEYTEDGATSVHAVLSGPFEYGDGSWALNLDGVLGCVALRQCKKLKMRPAKEAK